MMEEKPSRLKWYRKKRNEFAWLGVPSGLIGTFLNGIDNPAISGLSFFLRFFSLPILIVALYFSIMVIKEVYVIERKKVDG